MLNRMLTLLLFMLCVGTFSVYGAAEPIKPESTAWGEFGKLPLDTIHQIVSYLPARAQVRLGQASSLFYSMTLENSLLHRWMSKKIQPKIWDYAIAKRIDSLSFSCDGKVLAAGCGDERIRLIDVTFAPGGERKVLFDPGEYPEVSFSPVDTQLLGLVSSIGGYALVNLETETRQYIIDEYPYNLHRKIIFSDNGKFLAAADSHANIWLAGIVADRKLENVRIIKSLGGSKDAYSLDIQSVSLVSDKRLLVAATRWDGGGIGIYDINIADGATSEIVHIKADNLECASYACPGPVNSISPDGMTFACEFTWDFHNHHLVLWNLKSNRKIAELNISAELRGVAFSPDGKIVAAKLFNGHVILVNAQTGEQVRDLVPPQKIEQRRSSALTFSPRGDVLAAGYDDGNIVLWRVDK